MGDARPMDGHLVSKRLQIWQFRQRPRSFAPIDGHQDGFPRMVTFTAGRHIAARAQPMDWATRQVGGWRSLRPRVKSHRRSPLADPIGGHLPSFRAPSKVVHRALPRDGHLPPISSDLCSHGWRPIPQIQTPDCPWTDTCDPIGGYPSISNSLWCLIFWTPKGIQGPKC